jgi:hypothetical protein
VRNDVHSAAVQRLYRDAAHTGQVSEPRSGIQRDAVVFDWRRRDDQVARAVEPHALDSKPAAGRCIRASALFVRPIWRHDFG